MDPFCPQSFDPKTVRPSHGAITEWADGSLASEIQVPRESFTPIGARSVESRAAKPDDPPPILPDETPGPAHATPTPTFLAETFREGAPAPGPRLSDAFRRKRSPQGGAAAASP
jgi:hypothetical protein